MNGMERKKLPAGMLPVRELFLTSSVMRRGSYASLTGMEPKRLLKLP
jgi:hypothetical protein